MQIRIFQSLKNINHTYPWVMKVHSGLKPESSVGEICKLVSKTLLKWHPQGMKTILIKEWKKKSLNALKCVGFMKVT